MDKRLKDVHTTDLTESRVNEDFVEWLKKSGPTWLIAILIAVGGCLAIINWRKGQQASYDQAWRDYHQAYMPGAFEDVANQHGDVDLLAPHSWLMAAQMKLTAVQRGVTVSALGAVDGNVTEASRLDEETRAQYLDEAASLFESVIDRFGDDPAVALPAGSALCGRAAVAEALGDAETARSWYERAAERFGDAYPAKAEEALAHAATAEKFAADVPLPDQSLALRNRQRAMQAVPVSMLPALEQFLEEPADDSEGDDGATPSS